MLPDCIGEKRRNSAEIGLLAEVMSIWGKIGGAAAGFIAGGPVGATLGAVAGHVLFDRDADPSGDPGISFTIAVIALGAKMAKADGVVTQDEEEAFALV